MKNLLLVFLLALGFTATSQDIIELKSGKSRSAIIKEIGVVEIKFSKPNSSRSVLYSVLRDDVSRIVYESGEVEVFTSNLSNADIYSDNKKNAIKLDFISPIAGSLALTYERSKRPGFNLETGINLIGVGKGQSGRTANGLGLRFGPKFIYTPDFHVNGLRYMHVMQGLYVKPEVIVGFFNEEISADPFYPTEGSKSNVSYGIGMVTVGKQWVFQNSFLVDLYGGLGYGLIDGDGSPEAYHFDFIGNPDSWNLVVSLGFKVGILLR